MKTRENKIQEIHRLLNRWYSGETGAEEERILGRMLSEEELPSDLIEEREFFRALKDAADTESDIPADIEARLDASLTNEIGNGKRRRLRIWLISAGFTAACLTALLWRFPVTDKQDILPYTPGLAKTEQVKENKRPESGRNENNMIKNDDSSEIKVKKIKKNRLVIIDKEEAASERLYAACGREVEELDAEEERLMAKGYKIVTNQDEADRILKVALSEIETTMAVETYRIEEMESRYRMLNAKFDD